MERNTHSIESPQTRLVEGNLGDNEQTALGYWSAQISEVDQAIARNLFNRPKTAPRTGDRWVVSDRTVTPWISRAFAREQEARGLFTKFHAYMFMGAACGHYLAFLKEQHRYARSLVTKEDLARWHKFTEGFIELAVREDNQSSAQRLIKNLMLFNIERQSF